MCWAIAPSSAWTITTTLRADSVSTLRWRTLIPLACRPAAELVRPFGKAVADLERANDAPQHLAVIKAV